MLKSKFGKVDVVGPFEEVASDFAILCATLIIDTCKIDKELDPKEVRKVFMKVAREGFDKGIEFLKLKQEGKNPIAEAIKDILSQENGEELIIEAMKLLIKEDADD